MTESSSPTPEMLMTRLKSQGFFDKIRKRILEDVECKPDYLYLKHNVVDSIVSQFLSRQCPVGSKLEMRDRLRREIHDNAIFQRSLSQMADRLLATQASPEALAPPINQVACEVLDVDYRDWLRRSKKQQTPQPLLPDTSIPPPVLAGTPEPLLPDPISTEEDPIHPLSTDVLPAPSAETEHQPTLACENEVEMEVDDVGDEMDVESTDSNVSITGYRPKQSLKASGADSYFPEDSVRTKFNQPALSSIGESSQPTPQPAIVNSSSFSRKFSAAVAGWIPNTSSKQLGINSDNETNHEDSPLRRRMSLAGQLAKRSSPPLSSAIKPNLDKNPSPLIEGRHRMSSPGQHRDRIRKHGGSNSERRYDNCDRTDYRRFRRNLEFQFQRQHSRHHNGGYRNSDRRRRDDGGRSSQSFDRQSYLFQDHNSDRNSRDYRSHNVFPSTSRSCSRGDSGSLLSCSQSPAYHPHHHNRRPNVILTKQSRRQRQASPHSALPDPPYPTSHRHRKKNFLGDASPRHRDSSRSRGPHRSSQREKDSRCQQTESGSQHFCGSESRSSTRPSQSTSQQHRPQRRLVYSSLSSRSHSECSFASP